MSQSSKGTGHADGIHVHFEHSETGFPGMEHQRDIGPEAGQSQMPPSPPAGPSRADRFDGLRLAVDLIRQQEGFRRPGDSAVIIADQLAQYLHSGDTGGVK